MHGDYFTIPQCGQAVLGKSAADQCQNCAQKSLKLKQLEFKGRHLFQESLATFQAKRQPVSRPEGTINACSVLLVESQPVLVKVLFR